MCKIKQSVSVQVKILYCIILYSYKRARRSSR